MGISVLIASKVDPITGCRGCNALIVFTNFPASKYAKEPLYRAAGIAELGLPFGLQPRQRNMRGCVPVKPYDTLEADGMAKLVTALLEPV